MERDNYLNYAGFQCLENLNHSSLDLYLTTCGMQNCVSRHSFGPGTRNMYILHFINDGKGIFAYRGNVYHLSKGDAFLIRPDAEVYYEADEKSPWSYMWVGFNGLKASAYLASAGLDEETVTCRCENTPLVFSYIQQMIIARHLTLSNELKRQSALLQILSVLIDEHKETLPKNERYDYPYRIYVEQAVDYIQRNFRTSIKINDVASYIGVDRSYLSGIFKSMTGVSPQEYLVRYRMEQAEGLLKSSDMMICEVAGQVGYADQLSFSKMFRRHSGMSPTEYREKNK